MGISSDVAFRSPWEDPQVRDRLKEGNQPTELWLINCPACGNHSYYNLGSHFTCGICDHGVDGDELDTLIDNGDAITLADFTDQQAYEDLMMEGL